MISPVLIASRPVADSGMEASAGNIFAAVLTAVLLLCGIAQGVFAYTGRWRSWHYNGTGMHGIAPPLTVFWASVTGLIVYVATICGVLGASNAALVIFLFGIPPGMITCVSFWWLPRFARPRWVAEEEARLLAKRDRPS
ncbi:hypothetical protein [Actinomadura rugatobispora]|uniref:Amino acid permease n=1 Tax=Actinomadura rugatobispora TaxID=1994 RepID=A0ABW0ZZR8_9ACTN|nr:hypothetical protein GCM10010200_049440 [Actinomadura rugatobispora]